MSFIATSLRNLSITETDIVRGGDAPDIVDDIVVRAGGFTYQPDLSQVWFVLDYSNNNGGVLVNYDYFENEYENPTEHQEITDNGFTTPQEEAFQKIALAQWAAIGEYINRTGNRDTILSFPNGFEIPAGQLYDALGRTISYVEAGTLGIAIARGDASVGDVASFFASSFFGGAALAAGFTPMGVFVAATVAGIMVGQGIDWYANAVGEAWREALSQHHANQLAGLPPQNYFQHIWSQFFNALSPQIDYGSWDDPSNPVSYQEP